VTATVRTINVRLMAPPLSSRAYVNNCKARG
jgi:hypothetical protein